MMIHLNWLKNLVRQGVLANVDVWKVHHDCGGEFDFVLGCGNVWSKCCDVLTPHGNPIVLFRETAAPSPVLSQNSRPKTGRSCTQANQTKFRCIITHQVPRVRKPPLIDVTCRCMCLFAQNSVGADVQEAEGLGITFLGEGEINLLRLGRGAVDVSFV